ncbi:hypothetical protein GCM10018954_082680 [Kutzneria kofuensis]
MCPGHAFQPQGVGGEGGLHFPLLSDFWPHGATAPGVRGVQRQGRHGLRGTFLIDKEGVIRFAEANQPGEARDQDQWKRALKAL